MVTSPNNLLKKQTKLKLKNSHCTENEMKDVGNLKHFSVIGNFSDLGNFRGKPSDVLEAYK